MRDFDLPLVDEATRIEDAFEPMIKRRVSGLVLDTPKEYRLLHYIQLRAAWEAGLHKVSDIKGYVVLGERPTSTETLQPQLDDYLLLSVTNDSAFLRSRRELFAITYESPSPGYCCNGTPQHFYPPHKRGPTPGCMVIGCGGIVP
jgi:hypothetical protein